MKGRLLVLTGMFALPAFAAAAAANYECMNGGSMRRVEVAFPVVGAAIQQWGWRTAWAGLGAALVLGLAPIAVALVRRGPRSIGVAPDGDGPADLTASIDTVPARSDALDTGHTWTDALGTGAFWVFAVGASLYGLVASGIRAIVRGFRVPPWRHDRLFLRFNHQTSRPLFPTRERFMSRRATCGCRCGKLRSAAENRHCVCMTPADRRGTTSAAVFRRYGSRGSRVAATSPASHDR